MHLGAPTIIRNIIGDDITGALAVGPGCVAHHHLPEEEWRVLLNLSCDIFGQQPRLEFETAMIAGLVPEEGMFNLFSEPLFEFREEDFASLILETIGSELDDEIIYGEHTIVE